VGALIDGRAGRRGTAAARLSARPLDQRRCGPRANTGFDRATGDIVICYDDDVRGRADHDRAVLPRPLPGPRPSSPALAPVITNYPAPGPGFHRLHRRIFSLGPLPRRAASRCTGFWRRLPGTDAGPPCRDVHRPPACSFRRSGRWPASVTMPATVAPRSERTSICAGPLWPPRRTPGPSPPDAASHRGTTGAAAPGPPAPRRRWIAAWGFLYRQASAEDAGHPSGPSPGT